MKIEHSDHVESSHVGHIAFVVLVFLIGAIVGYAVGVDWENSTFTEDNAAVTTSTVKKTTASTATTATTATTAATATTSAQ